MSILHYFNHLAKNKHLEHPNKYYKITDGMVKEKFIQVVKLFLNKLTTTEFYITNGKLNHDADQQVELFFNFTKLIGNEISTKYPDLINLEVKTQFDQELNFIKDLDHKSKFESLQFLFKKMLEFCRANEQHKEAIEELLWDLYFNEQKNIPLDFLASKDLNNCNEGFYAQVQTDPIKRLGYLIFMALYELIDQEKYENSNGLEKSASSQYIINNSVSENQVFQDLTGTSFPAPPVASTPSPSSA